MTVDVGVTLARIATGARRGDPRAGSNGPAPPRAAAGLRSAAARRSAAAAPSAPPPPPAAPRPRPSARPAATLAPPPPARRVAPLLARRPARRRGARRRPRPDRGHRPRGPRHEAGRHGRRRGAQRGVSVRGRGRSRSCTPRARTGPAPAARCRTGPYVPPPGRPLSRMRATIGEHMHRSLQTAATCTTWIEVDMSRIELSRKEVGLTALPLISRCVIHALVEFPLVNAWLEEGLQTVHVQVNLGTAVDLGDDDLIRPGRARRAGPQRRRHRPPHPRPRPRRRRPPAHARRRRGGMFMIMNPARPAR